MNDDTFYYDQLTCCSLILHWKEEDEANLKSFQLSQKEQGIFHSYDKIYEGKSNIYEVINLKSNQDYDFKLKINKFNPSTKKEISIEKKISVKTLISPHAVLSEKSVDIANDKQFKVVPKDIPDFQKKYIKNCAKFIFEEGNETSINAVFDGLILKITHESQSNMYYVFIDIKDDYFNEFFEQFIKEGGNNILIPSNFIITKLPTLLFLDLLNKAPVIFTGKRMGGVIASSLVFYLLYIGKSLGIKYDNAFLKREKKCIGSITFGSPSFTTNLTASVKMKEFTSYFFNIKEKYDYMPEIIDFMNEEKLEYLDEKNKLSLFQKEELMNDDVTFLDNYLKEIDFIEKEVKDYINKDIKIPFGYYFEMKKNENDFSLELIDESKFNNFYYLQKFKSKSRIVHLNIYKELSSNTKFDKMPLVYLENKNYHLELVKIIRRKIESGKSKAVIKFKLIKFDDNIIISPDLIKNISLVSNKTNYIIPNKDIYYNNDTDITAYLDDLEDNVIDVKIENIFGGEIKVKQVMNIQGSGSTRKMLKDNIEKLFLIPFFKLFEIFYISYNDGNKFCQLKEQYFGKNYENLKSKILKPFEKQIEILNKLLFLSRPDLLEKSLEKFIEMYIHDDIKKMNKNWTDEMNVNLNNHLKNFLDKAKQLKKSQNIDTKNKNKIKLFMSKCTYSELSDFYKINFDDSFIKDFFIEKLMSETLQIIEEKIKIKTDGLNDEDKYKKALNDHIGELYDFYIIVNIYLIRLLVLVSIEGGDLILTQKESWKKIMNNYLTFLGYINLAYLYGLSFFNEKLLDHVFSGVLEIIEFYPKMFYKDFEKYFTKKEIEEINMKNIFYKNKTKTIIKSNVSNAETNFSLDGINKIFAFSKYSKNNKIGEQYYINFLEIFNNSSNDFAEDIELLIYDNLKEENIKKEDNLSTIKDMINDVIVDEESKKGFLALLRQSFLLGKLRTNIVRKYFY